MKAKAQVGKKENKKTETKHIKNGIITKAVNKAVSYVV